MKQIPNFSNYTITKTGDVFNILTQKEVVKMTHENKNNYKSLYVSVKNNDSKWITTKISILMAITYLNHTPCGNTIVVDHINSNSFDNRLENLQLLTHGENTKKAKTK